MALQKKKGQIAIEVTDNGPGIHPDLHEQVFQRFYEKSPGQTLNQIRGTGIGLALSRQLVELHRGKIELLSSPGNGSSFRVHLPTGNEGQIKLKSSPTSKESSLPPIKPAPGEENKIAEGQPLPTITSAASILIVEDNPEVQAYIRSIFAEEYTILTAANGKQGFAIAEKEQPDLILSDVMMPLMDGYELCHTLKTTFSTSHIPVILLTARTTMDDRLEGLETGADDYLSKPFHPNELRLKVRNRLALRQRMREQFGQQRTFNPKEASVTSADEEFLQRLIELVEENIENPSFNIEQFAQELAVSRALLFTKIKALTNHTPKNFLKSFRLKRAAQLLKTRKLNVSEVAYRVGFNAPKYFSKVFQKEFGCTPSEFAANQHSSGPNARE